MLSLDIRHVDEKLSACFLIVSIIIYQIKTQAISNDMDTLLGHIMKHVAYETTFTRSEKKAEVIYNLLN